MRHAPVYRALTTLCVLIVQAAPVGATDWLQFGYDTVHSGFDRDEHGYPTLAGNPLLYHYGLPGPTDSAPVYLADVATSSGTKDLLFVVATDGTLLALDAHASTLHVIWSHHPTGSGTVTSGAAAIDPGRAYVYAYALDGKVHKYHVGDGSEVTTGGWPQVSTLKPDHEKGAAGLSIATAQNGNTYLYSVTSGYIDDLDDFQGHVTAINLGSGSQAVFNSQCSNLTIHFVASGITTGAGQNDCQRIGGGNSGIWGRPGAVYDSGTDRLFITTGNGLFDPGNVLGSGIDWGDSVLALHADGSGAGNGMPVDSYTPGTYGSENPKVGLQGYDADLGSTSIAIVPAPAGTATQYRHLAVQAGKDGCVRLINLANLSGQGAPAHVGGELQAQNFPTGVNCVSGQDGPEIKSQPAVWVNPADGSSWVYIETDYAGLAAYKVVLDGSGRPSLSMRWTGHAGNSPIVANGIVYFISDARLYAVDAVTGAKAVSDTSTWGTTLLNNSHWQSPIIVGGRVYVIDGAYKGSPSQLWVYGLDGAFKAGFE